MSSGGGHPGFAASPFGGGGFEGEMSPEDLFNMFFGGGGGMGGMGVGGGVFGDDLGTSRFMRPGLGGQFAGSSGASFFS